MKKTFISVLAIGTLLSAGVVFAEDRGDNRDDIRMPSLSAVTHVNFDSHSDDSKKEDKHRENKNSNSLVRLQARGIQLINARISDLQSNEKAITKSQLGVDQKAALFSIINTNVLGLTALKTAIGTSTDATSTKALIDSVYTKFRIYGVVIPQIRLEKRIYDLQNHVTKLSDSFIKVQARIDEYKGKGRDVSVWQKNLEEAKLLVATNVGKLAALMVQAQSLKPSDYGTSTKATIEAINVGIKAVAKDFNTIQKTINKPKMSNGVHATSTPLTASEWVWVSATSNGSTTVAASPDKFVLDFDKNNSVSSKTDCNNVAGSYAAGTTSLSFGVLSMTKMFCAGSQETMYAQLLGKVSAYSISGTTLTLTHNTGVMIFRKK